MTPEKEQKLFDVFPNLYRGRVKSIQESLMSFGFQCDDGWFDLIWNLSREIEDSATKDRIEPRSETWPETVQVKEKFGTLRFQLRKPTEAMRTLIREAFEESEKTCEVCGMPGFMTTENYVKTLCHDHAEEFSAKSRMHAKTPIWKLLKEED
jgi:hypothetical protein